MKIVCFPHFYYLSEASRLVEIGKALRDLGQDIVFFSYGGPYENVAKDEGFEVIPVQPTMPPDRAEDYKAFKRAERGNPFRDSFFSYEELKGDVRHEADAFRQVGADAVLIGWNLPSYLSVQLVGIPIIVQQPGPFTAPFFDKKMGVFVPSLVGWLRHLPMDWFVNWLIPRTKLCLAPFNRLAADLGLPQYKSLLDMMAGDLTLVMDTPEILGITREELEHYRPRHAAFFHRPPRYRYGVPMHLEQAGNISLVTRQNAGVMLSKYELNRQKLASALEQLVSKPRFRQNMLRLKALQDRVDGAAIASKELVNFLDGRG